MGIEDDVNCDYDKRLRIDTPTFSDGRLTYKTSTLSSTWYDHVNNAIGYSVKFRIKVIDSGTYKCQEFYIDDKTYVCSIYLKSNSISVDAVFIAEATQSYSVDLTDGYHIVEINIIGTSLSVKIDGVERITGTLNAASGGEGSQYLEFGDKSSTAGYGGEVYWDYIKYKVT